MAYDIFLSYRRIGGYETAKHLYDLLVYDGYTVSFDIDTLRSGYFDNELLKRIDECTDFIIVLNKGVFDRCLDETVNRKQDWLRNELAYAISKKKNIVPIMLEGFTSFPENLPADIADIARKNSPKYDQYYFDGFYRRLKEAFLETPSPVPAAKKKNITKKALFALLVVLLLASISLFVWKKSNSSSNETLPFISTSQNSDAPTNLMQNIKTGMPIKFVEEHFGMQKENDVWLFKNLILQLEKANDGNILSILYRYRLNWGDSYEKTPLFGEVNLPWDNVIAQYKIPNFGVATFGDILDKLHYDGENLSWIGSFEFNPCFEAHDYGASPLYSECLEYIRLTIGPDKSTNFRTYILATEDAVGWWYDAKNKYYDPQQSTYKDKNKWDLCEQIEEKLKSASEKDDFNPNKDFSVLNDEEFNQVFEMIKKTKITSLSIK